MGVNSFIFLCGFEQIFAKITNNVPNNFYEINKYNIILNIYKYFMTKSWSKAYEQWLSNKFAKQFEIRDFMQNSYLFSFRV